MSAPPMRVLCVEDDRINAMLLEEMCRLAGGVEARVAESAADALALAAQWPPHLLVVDMHLPDGDGLSLLPRLRESIAPAPVKAVLCTAELLSDVAARAEAAGYDGCWAKPVLLDDVRSALAAFAAAHARSVAG